MNKTSICSIVFLDIIDYSKKADAEQIEVKKQFNDLINRSLKGVAQNDRIILDTGDGVAIAHMGSPEDAMFVALTIRDGILKSNVHNPAPLYVRFGINLGPVRIVSDINGHPNIIGDGINVAQRIMSFAEANQILVSRSYYEVTSRLTLEFSEMFAYSGVKHDKHVREHEVYSVRSHKEDCGNESQPTAQKDDRRLTHQLVTDKKSNWKYAILALPAVVAFGLIIKMAAAPSEPIILLDEANAEETITSSVAITAATKPSSDGLRMAPESLPVSKIDADKESELKLEKTLEQKLADKESAEPKLVKKMAKKKEKRITESELAALVVTSPTKTAKNVNSESKPVAPPAKAVVNSPKIAESKEEKVATGNKTSWDSFKESVKQGAESKCTQAEISMNQCR